MLKNGRNNLRLWKKYRYLDVRIDLRIVGGAPLGILMFSSIAEMRVDKNGLGTEKNVCCNIDF